MVSCRPEIPTSSRARLTWDVDGFLGDITGLVFAEVDLISEDQTIECADLISAEVTTVRRSFTSNLATMPYRQWADGWS